MACVPSRAQSLGFPHPLWEDDGMSEGEFRDVMERYAATLNRLSLDDIQAMRGSARDAARMLNADVEMGKIVDRYGGLFEQPRMAVIAS